jgi:hypothetical protein
MAPNSEDPWPSIHNPQLSAQNPQLGIQNLQLSLENLQLAADALSRCPRRATRGKGDGARHRPQPRTDPVKLAFCVGGRGARPAFEAADEHLDRATSGPPS